MWQHRPAQKNNQSKHGPKTAHGTIDDAELIFPSVDAQQPLLLNVQRLKSAGQELAHPVDILV